MRMGDVVFDSEAAYALLLEVSREEGLPNLLTSFNKEYVKELLRYHALTLRKTKSKGKDECLARICFEKLKSCISAFDEFNSLARKMDKEHFQKLFLSGSFQVCGIYRLGNAPVAFCNTGRMAQGCRLLRRGSPKYKALLVSTLWQLVTFNAQTALITTGGITESLLVIDEMDRELLDFNNHFTKDFFGLLDKLVPLRGKAVIYGFSKVVSPVLTLFRIFFPDDICNTKFIFRGEDPIEYLGSRIVPGPGEDNWIPEYLARASVSDNQGSVLDDGVPLFVPYDPSNRRNVFMIEKLLDDLETITAADVYNNPQYDWGIPFSVRSISGTEGGHGGVSVLPTIVEESEGSVDSW